ncbi:dihydropteroate synthase [Roseivirga misakiensis]|uniref:dihydropteroate synthase n=1 Tax=Roseivirga misakiensis TaxID=1563681 RepID=A0A1E5T243_9BACT|nr:dihydropteroate synthase [Roseivirga misakiensis]OEK05453.1 dihydropteroate synthase [Roseivirga misakiensis]
MKAKDNLFQVKTTLNIRGNLVSLETPKVMGILNVTPDSFYAESRADSIDQILKRAEQMLIEGASILDIGGYSTRPGADDISPAEELERVVEPIKSISQRFPEAIISIDTFRAEVAKAAVDAGATMVNDVSGGNLDNKMFETVGQLKVPYVLMHMRGTPQTMKSLVNYDHLLNDILFELDEKCHRLIEHGVYDILIDPGFGFAKTIDQNYEILRNLGLFKRLNHPILAGLSRKSMIYKRLDSTADEALNGTTALNMAALINGASILRVHDVKAATETITLYEAYKG